MNDAAAAAEEPAKKQPLWRRIGRPIMVYILVPYLAVTIIMAVFQRRLMYQPSIAPSLQTTDLGLEGQGIRDLRLTTADGLELNGWLISPRDAAAPSRPLVIYFPGNASHRYGRLDDLREIASAGFDVMIFDYRGYGDNGGRPTEAGLSSDARDVLNFARTELGYDEAHIVFFGESLGGAVALSLWSGPSETHPQPAALIVNSTFASMPDTVAWHYPMFPFRWLVLDRWPSIGRIASVKVPVIVFHGTDDDIVPVAQARQLAAAATEAELIETPGGHHNLIPMLKLRLVLREIREKLVESQ